jgi:hypothetical protein
LVLVFAWGSVDKTASTTRSVRTENVNLNYIKHLP